SLEPPDMTRFVETIRSLHTAFGARRRILTPAELRKRQEIRRSVHVKHNLAAGHRLSLSDLDYRRPGHGIPPSEVDRLVGRRLLRDKSAGERLEWSDLEE